MVLAADSRLIELGTIAAGGNGARVEFPMVDTSDCQELVAMAQTPHTLGLIMADFINTSPDGLIRIRRATELSTEQQSQATLDLASTTSGRITNPIPYMQLIVFNQGPPADVSAWLWCVKRPGSAGVVGGVAEPFAEPFEVTPAAGGIPLCR